MKRSEINDLIQDAIACFQSNGWALPPDPRWDVTDFGLGDWRRFGLVLVNLADEPEYCEKLMYAQRGMATPAHCHRRKKEDIVSRWGTLRVTLWPCEPGTCGDQSMWVQVNGKLLSVESGGAVELSAGERITLVPGMYHEFVPVTDECVIGEVSTANDDLNDNFFANKEVGRYATIEEDEPAVVRLSSD
ncbi:D-lyxose/D-mannose family sugar isomerase [Fimbriimonas ginsengisoli]|nr:D-lyxose/D-mannose family sugar isomerase [Fimbriimonas ginsengisoli]